MKPTSILLLWILFIQLEVLRNWYMIEVKDIEINHRRQVIIRCVLGFIFWIVTGIYSSNLEHAAWLIMPLMMGLVFWPMFDMELNLFRGLPISYFGTGPKSSWLDRKQSKWPLPWMYFKLFLAGVSIMLYYKLPDLL